MFLESRTNFLNIQIVNIVQVYDGVGVSHRDSREVVGVPVYLYWLVDSLTLVRDNGNFRSLQDWGAHIDSHQGDFSIFHSQIQFFDPLLVAMRSVVLGTMP